MTRDGQLTPTEISSMESWVILLSEHLQRFPELPSSVDLVIEGGVGNGTTMPHIVQRLFPGALYVGTDLSPQLMWRKSRLSRRIDTESLQQLLASDNGTAKNLERSVVYANCFDADLVRDILRKTGRAIPFLVSFNAIVSLTDRKLNMEERKDRGDDIPVSNWFSPNLPYVGQMHLMNYPLDWESIRPSSVFDSAMRSVASNAELNDYHVERMDMGILVVKRQ